MLSHAVIVWSILCVVLTSLAGLTACFRGKPVAQWQRRLGEKVLQSLYIGATFFAVFMFVWTVVSPATWRLGNTPGWEERTRERYGKNFSVPLSLLLKYNGHRAVQFTHTLPSAIWAAIVPFQLNPWFRRSHRRWHQRFGYVFLGAALLIFIGFTIILHRRLDFARHDFPGIPEEEGTSAIGLGGVPIVLKLQVVATLFLLFAGLALRSAIRRDFVLHRKWILRHIAWGLWVAPHRMYVGIMWGSSPSEQKAHFGDGGWVGLLLTAGGAELAIWIYSWQFAQAEKKEG